MEAHCGFSVDQQTQQHPCVSVQHDLLLALLGHVGDLFVDASKYNHGKSSLKDARVSSFKVAPWAHWIDACDRCGPALSCSQTWTRTCCFPSSPKGIALWLNLSSRCHTQRLLDPDVDALQSQLLTTIVLHRYGTD